MILGQFGVVIAMNVGRRTQEKCWVWGWMMQPQKAFFSSILSMETKHQFVVTEVTL
jgi:hypothetical protein